MPHAAVKAASPSSRHPPRPHPVSRPPPSSHQPETRQLQPSTKKRVARPPRYHETKAFLDCESFQGLALTDGLVSPATWFPAETLGAAYRAVSTLLQAAYQASQQTKPVSWGYGAVDGALGHNNTQRVAEIKRLALFRRTDTRAISAGNRLSLFLSEDNRVFQSGRLALKQDGCAMWKPVEIPIKAGDLQATSVKIVAVEAGHLAAYALDADGRLYAWGTHLFGQLGYEEEPEPVVEEIKATSSSEDLATEQLEDGDDMAEEDEELPVAKLVIVEKVPRVVEALTGHAFVKVSAGNHFVIAISSTGEVFSWGRGCFGQLGNGDTCNVTVPTRIPTLEAFVALDIAAGTGHVLGVFVAREKSPHPNQAENTVVLAWGRGKDGCLGLGGANNESLPVENAFFRGLGAASVAAGGDHSLVLCRASTQTFLYAFGGNCLGQLGVASAADHIDMPSLVDEFLNVHVAAIGAGAQYSAALTGDGELFTWGDARYGKTCRSDGRTTFVPWKVELPSSLAPSFATQLSVGTHHSLAQLRVHGETDRWRKAPLPGIATALTDDPDCDKGAVCRCPSSQTTTQGVLGVFVQCLTCQTPVLCRACCRRCHSGHALRPTAVGRASTSTCSCSQASVCVFAKSLPPKILEE